MSYGNFDSSYAAEPVVLDSLTPVRQATRRVRRAPYRLRSGTAAALVVDLLKAHPPGAVMSTRELSVATGVPIANFVLKMRAAVAGGVLYRHPVVPGSRHQALWSLVDPTQAAPRAKNRSPAMPNWRPGEAMASAKAFSAVPPSMVGRLRDIFFLGDANVSGDPLRMLSNALDAARAVMAAKSASRFNSAEVDAMVARELRAISEAAHLATLNLAQALEIMQ